MSATPDELTAESVRWLRFAVEDLAAAEALADVCAVGPRAG
jgi:hypothetical protein